MVNVKVIGIGHGTNFISYGFDFSFTMSGHRTLWEMDEIKALAIRKAKDKTACNAVSLWTLIVDGEEVEL